MLLFVGTEDCVSEGEEENEDKMEARLPLPEPRTRRRQRGGETRNVALTQLTHAARGRGDRRPSAARSPEARARRSIFSRCRLQLLWLRSVLCELWSGRGTGAPPDMRTPVTPPQPSIVTDICIATIQTKDIVLQCKRILFV